MQPVPLTLLLGSLATAQSAQLAQERGREDWQGTAPLSAEARSYTGRTCDSLNAPWEPAT